MIRVQVIKVKYVWVLKFDRLSPCKKAEISFESSNQKEEVEKNWSV